MNEIGVLKLNQNYRVIPLTSKREFFNNIWRLTTVAKSNTAFNLNLKLQKVFFSLFFLVIGRSMFRTIISHFY